MRRLPIGPTIRGLLRLALALGTGLALAGIACAQSDRAPAPRSLTVELLQGRQAAVEARRDIDAPTKATILDLYKRALGELERARTSNEEAQRLRSELAGAPAEVRRLEREYLAIEKRPEAKAEAPGAEGASAADLRQTEATARAAAEEARQRLEEAQREWDAQAGRPFTIAQEKSRVRTELDVQRSDVARAQPPGRTSALHEAHTLFARARASALEAELASLEAEAAYQPARARITQLERDIARSRLRQADEGVERLMALAEQRRRADVAAARSEAERAEERLRGQPAAVRELAARNAAIAATLADTTGALDRTLLSLSRMRSLHAQIEDRRRLVQRASENRKMGPELAQTIFERLRELPGADQFARQRAARARGLQAALDADVGLSRQIAELQDLDAAVARTLETAGVDPSDPARGRLEAAAREQLSARLGLLVRLQEQQTALVQALRETDQAEADLAQGVAEARDDFVRQLFWVPLNPLGRHTLKDLPAAIAWTLSAQNWTEALSALAGVVERNPLRAALIGALVVGLLVGRGRLRRRLADLAPAAVSYEQYRIGHTLAALALTLLLALPGALLAWAAGIALEQAPEAGAFARSVGLALRLVGETLVSVSAFAWLFDGDGVGIRHFHWPTEAMVSVQRALRRLLPPYVLLVFVSALNTVYAPHPNRDSLGRVAFMLALLVVALFLWRVLRRGSTLMRQVLPEGSPSLAARLHPLWMTLVVALPAGLAVLAGAGFFFAATALYTLFRNSVLLALGAVVLYGLTALWVLVQRARLGLREAREAASGEPTEERAAAPAVRLDVAAMSEQTRRLLDLLTTLLLVGGLWLIWRDAVPFLRVIGEAPLWTYTETVDGELASRAFTLGALVLAAVVVFVTAIATRNIGAVLDIVLLQRLELQKDATYAIKTITRYAIVGAGVVLASNLLGVSWGKAQWLVAALGVGLGFGLQEIVANFVSGLIVLGERPIRVGDVVTVGEVSGTVSRIRARATAVIDFENKEVLIPNKAFITERVVNWTLSSSVTRLLLKIGVAYGTDPERVRALLLDVARANPDVLPEPAPNVWFLAFGESSLDFEIRVWVDGVDKRLRVSHEINTAVARTLAEHGIEIPFPQRDLHVRTAPGLKGIGRTEDPGAA